MLRISSYWQTLFRHETGRSFPATLQPVEDMKIYNDDYFQVRQILRVFPPTKGIRAGDVVQENTGVWYLLGEYDHRWNYTSFRAYPCNQQLLWTRMETTVDPLTGLPRGTTAVTLGEPWVLSEVITREARGGDIKTKEEITRVLTGAPVELNDKLAGRTVMKVTPALGIRVLELQ